MKVSLKPDETEKGIGFWSFVKVHETLIWITFAIQGGPERMQSLISKKLGSRSN